MNTAETYYSEAREKWQLIVDLTNYDDIDMMYVITPLLENALKADPIHVKSLHLISDLLLYHGANEEGLFYLNKIGSMDSADEDYLSKMQLFNKDLITNDALRQYLKKKWYAGDF